MKAVDVRKKYLEYFQSQGHVVVPSASLVPENDATTLFTGSGMQPMVPYLLGEPHPLGTRIADSQKSFRSQDIEEVGDNRHTTFFEMLGNWSLGDYFKQEQIPWMFTFLTKELGLDPKRIYVTCFRGNDELGIPRDTEAAELWKGLFAEAGVEAPIVDFPERDGMQGGRIFYYNEKKNWWSRSGVPSAMPVGEPGGPDTEMFWDFLAQGQSVSGGGEIVDTVFHPNSEWKEEVCHVNCDCGRFMEIGNNVFMEYIKTETGFEKLKQQNVDFGGGLERMVAAVLDCPDMFKVDLLWGLIAHVEQITGKQYGESLEVTKQMRIVADHIRGSVFLVSDGVIPSNKDRGYVLRRLLRRSMVAVRMLGSQADWIPHAVETVIATYADAYPELQANAERITKVIEDEKNKFSATLDKGIREFRKIALGNSLDVEVGGLRDKAIKSFTAVDAFNLYQTYGFPWELTRDLAKENGLVVDEEEFKAEFKKHQDLSRTASAGEFKGGLGGTGEIYTRYHTATHLLQKALRTVLGEDVWQKGSNITEERTRFDFTFPRKMTEEEKAQVEKLVNEWIQRDLPVKHETIPLEEARQRGAIGLFGEKYPDTVSVYGVYDPATNEAVSLEFCGGPHVERTGVIGSFKIQKEEAVSAGVRRIKGVIEA
ncbi:MAG: alanine--tRNA ligase [Candidatus Doudnabacteria bacterium]|nr:alanine--tRNA ligase [Candidatus Doudnabacteria bacterium]